MWMSQGKHLAKATHHGNLVVRSIIFHIPLHIFRPAGERKAVCHKPSAELLRRQHWAQVILGHRTRSTAKGCERNPLFQCAGIIALEIKAEELPSDERR